MEALTWVHENMSSEILDTIMKFISCSGDYAAVWIILSIVLLIKKPTREIGIVMFFAILMGFLLNDLMIKPLIERPRPFIDDPSLPLVISPPGGYSFTSGHTVKAFAAAFVMFIYDRKWGTGFLVYATLIGFSRVYLMVHYPSDIIAGVLIGILCAVAVYSIIKYCKKRHCYPDTETEK